MLVKQCDYDRGVFKAQISRSRDAELGRLVENFIHS